MEANYKVTCSLSTSFLVSRETWAYYLLAMWRETGKNGVQMGKLTWRDEGKHLVDLLRYYGWIVVVATAIAVPTAAGMREHIFGHCFTACGTPVERQRIDERLKIGLLDTRAHWSEFFTFRAQRTADCFRELVELFLPRPPLRESMGTEHGNSHADQNIEERREVNFVHYLLDFLVSVLVTGSLTTVVQLLGWRPPLRCEFRK